MTRMPDASSPKDYRVTIGNVALREPFLPILVVGPPRSGKTFMVASRILQKWPGPSIVTSIRDDIVRLTSRQRSSPDGPSHGKSFVFDPSESSYTINEFGEIELVGFNPIDFSAPWDEAVRMANAIRDASSQGGQGLQDPGFWYDLAADLLACLLFAAARSGRTMADVRRWVKEREPFETKALLNATNDDAAIGAFEAAIGREQRVQDSVYTTLERVLGAYNTEEAIRTAGKNPLRPDTFFDREESGVAPTLYLCAPPAKQVEYRPVFVTLIRYFMDWVYSNNRRTPPVWDDMGFAHWLQGDEEHHAPPGVPLLVLLDEAGNVAGFNAYDTLVTTAAGAGIQLVSVYHDLAQMESLFGAARAANAFNSHSVVVAMPGTRDARLGTFFPADGQQSLQTLESGKVLLINENVSPQIVDIR